MADPATDAVIVSSLITATVSSGLSIGASVLFRPKEPQSPISYPQNSITRGGYLPTVLGRRVVGCHIGWVGDRVSQAASHAGGSELTPQASSGNIFFEGGWHQLCHGPVSSLYRIWAGATCIWSRELDAATTPSGTMFQLPVLNGARVGDYFRIYFGENDQPADAYLNEHTTIPSTYPGLCYVMWQRKNLGGAPIWPLMKYEVRT